MPSWLKTIIGWISKLFRNENSSIDRGSGKLPPVSEGSEDGHTDMGSEGTSLKTVEWTVKLRHPQGKWEKTLTTPITGKFCTEAHYATTSDSFGGKLFPSSQSEGITIHLARSAERLNADPNSIYDASYKRVWTPPEGGKAGQGSVGDLKPSVEEEMWQGNMMWADGYKPRPGTKFLVTNPKNKKACVIQMGYETGPADQKYVGGLVSEVHWYLESNDETNLILERPVDQTISLGPLSGSARTGPEEVLPSSSEDAIGIDSELSYPWRDWFVARLGWTEFTHDKELSVGWKLTKYCKSYKTVIGEEHAWCGMSLATALDSCGYAYPEQCETASEWDKYGEAIDRSKDGIPQGAIITIRHANGGRHVTTANRRHEVGEAVLEALGGNQSSSINITTYSLAPGRDSIVAVRWPVKKAGLI